MTMLTRHLYERQQDCSGGPCIGDGPSNSDSGNSSSGSGIDDNVSAITNKFP